MTHARGGVSTGPAYASLKSFLIETTGLAYYEDRDEQLIDLLNRHLAQKGIADYAAYLSKLQSGDYPHEIDRLVCDLTIGETHFFRHAELFDALRRMVLPPLVESRSPARPLRIWSAGCSLGAEVYSLSILLRRDLAYLTQGTEISIFGTDINHEFLAQAERGVFSKWTMRGVPEDVRAACFTRRGSSWEIRPEYRAGVHFRHHNLVAEPFPNGDLASLDVVLCRNVMIYFEPELIHRLTQQFRDSLAPGGWLLVGHAEGSVGGFPGFEPVYAPGVVLHRRRDDAAVPPPSLLGLPLFENLESWATEVIPNAKPNEAAPDTVASAGAAPVARVHPEPPSAPPTPVEPPRDSPQLDDWLDRGEWTNVTAHCSEHVAQDPFDVDAYYYRALALEHLDKPEEAERDLRRTLYLDRSHVLANVQLALHLERTGRTAEARLLFRTAWRLVEALGEDTLAGRSGDLTVGEIRSLVRTRCEECCDG